MFLFCNEDKKKKERLNSVLKTTHNLIKKNDIKDVRKNPVYSLIRAMSNYHLYDIVVVKVDYICHGFHRSNREVLQLICY